MNKLSEDTLFEEYMADTKDDIRAIDFINSPKCTLEMINYDNGDGWCALNLAARLNRYHVVEALINKGADVNHVSWDSSMNPLMYAINDGDYYENDGSKADNLKTIHLLINAGTDLNYGDRFSAFTLACQVNKTEVICGLLYNKININFKDEDGNTGIDYLKENHNEEALKLIDNYLLNTRLEKELSTNTKETKKHKI
jgi:ankyrin repeat protein